MKPAFKHLPLLCILSLFGWTGETLAQSADHDQARRALERGEVLPFEQILQAAQTRAVGDTFLDAVAGPHRGIPAVEVFFVTSGGRVHSVLVDARNARVIGKGDVLRGHINKRDTRPPPPPRGGQPGRSRGNPRPPR